jgi:phosphohistidine phosphatase
LTPAGREAVERVARRAAEKVMPISIIYHSGIPRAVQTAEIFALHFAPTQGLRVLGGLRPEDDPYIAAAELSAATAPVMLVGHLPHLGRLASLLSSGDPDSHTIDFRPATLASYSPHVSLWKLNWTIAAE